ncbi:hypothetical protein FHS82_003478 [Pseudochelatococcus lubricantis]|uniref:DUF721 domain-containing protein n=1 Tax=Pseudochelatococcus lubricantis TaxID=1538102 RepID=A0ABX0V769_9HYPH|nr:DciA family protein [Pseudochelatococcus lubricantis]NIJ59620.1 hypothetical protein [Pseudochelatococcus lubricantis]
MVNVRHSVRLKPLAELVDRCIEPVLAAQGFAAADVILAWPEIVGERLARHTEPLQVLWPRRGRGAGGTGGRANRKMPQYDEAASQPATLVVRVTGAFALELQHMAPVVVERVNVHFGWRCVGQLALRQGPIRRRTVAPVPEPKLDPAQERMVRDAVANVADDPLRQALERLGRAVLARGNG